MHLKPGQDFFPNSEDTLKRESKCAKDSGSLSQKVQFGDCERPKRNTLSFVKTVNGVCVCIKILSVWNQV